jgi:hypothetical protein
MKSIYFLAVILIFFLASCCTTKDNPGTKSGKVKNQPVIQQLIVDKAFVCPIENVGYNIQSASIVDSTLTVTITYKGTSEKDEFNIYFNGMYAKSLPAIATLCIVQKKMGDKEFSKELKFNIADARYMKGDKTFIMINGFSEKLTLMN